jgi:hypothetical protein
MNTSRRDKYANDPEYRARILARAERQRTQKAKAEGRSPSVSKYNAKLRDYVLSGLFARHGKERTEVATGKTQYTLTALEMSAVLGRSPELFSSWLKRGYIPRPVTKAKSGRGPAFYCYSVPEAKKILLAILSIICGQTGHLREHHREPLQKALAGRR